jgi:DNA repair protein RecO
VYDLIRIEKRPGTLDILTKAERQRSFLHLRKEYPRYVAACYGAQLVDEFAPDGQPIDGLYDDLIQLLERLDTGVPVADAVFSFETAAFRDLGYLPRVRDCGVCQKPISRAEAYFSVRDGGGLCVECRPREERWFPVRRASLESIARFSEGDMPREVMKRPLIVELRQIFDALVRYHLERDLPSARFLRETL